MGGVRDGRARWAAATVGLVVGVAALLAGTTGVAHAGGPGYAGGSVGAPAPDGAYRMVPLPRPGASQGVASAPDPGRPGDSRHWREPGHDDRRGHPGNWRRDDWRYDDWRHHGYWHDGRWYPYGYYGYYGWRPAYPGQWLWDGWRWVWVPAH